MQTAVKPAKLAKAKDVFERDGVVLMHSVIGRASVDELREATEQALSTSDNYFRRHTLWPDEPRFKNFCFHSELPSLAADLMQSKQVNLLYDQVFVKEPGSATATPWHNDQPYWPVRGWNVMTLWIALDAITPESGAMEFIRGSHRWNRWFQPFLAASDGSVDKDYEASEQFESLPDFDSERAGLDVVCFDMQPGDVIAFHALMVHGACANCAQTRRRGYAIRFTGDDTTYFEGPGTNPRLLNPMLTPGRPMSSELFPLVWQAR